MPTPAQSMHKFRRHHRTVIGESDRRNLSLPGPSRITPFGWGQQKLNSVRVHQLATVLLARPRPVCRTIPTAAILGLRSVEIHRLTTTTTHGRTTGEWLSQDETANRGGGRTNHSIRIIIIREEDWTRDGRTTLHTLTLSGLLLNCNWLPGCCAKWISPFNSRHCFNYWIFKQKR